MKDGLLTYCRKCVNAYRRKRHSIQGLSKKENEYQINYRKTEKYKEIQKRYHQNNQSVVQEWRNKNRESINAKAREYLRRPDAQFKEICRRKTRQFIYGGKLTRGACCKCGAEKVDAHHEDYTKPLDVIWLCRKHHHELHKNINDKKGINLN